MFQTLAIVLLSAGVVVPSDAAANHPTAVENAAPTDRAAATDRAATAAKATAPEPTKATDNVLAAPSPEMIRALRIASDAHEKMVNGIRDYTCQLTKRERVNGRLFEYETMSLKIRHPRVENGQVVTPLSIYIKFHSPSRLKGREVIYVAGRNDDKMIVRAGGTRLGSFVTTSLAPDSPAAMRQNRYPTTEVGVLNLTARLIEAGEGNLHCPDCSTTITAGAKINDRSCTLIQVSNVVQREAQTFKIARIFVDDQLQMPVRYSAYDWPKDEDGQLILLEEYTYTNIKLNVGLTDRDFDHRNEEYEFMKSFRP